MGLQLDRFEYYIYLVYHLPFTINCYGEKTARRVVGAAVLGGCVAAQRRRPVRFIFRKKEKREVKKGRTKMKKKKKRIIELWAFSLVGELNLNPSKQIQR